MYLSLPLSAQSSTSYEIYSAWYTLEYSAQEYIYAHLPQFWAYIQDTFLCRAIIYFDLVVIQYLICIWFCDPTCCNTQGSSVLQYLQEFAQIHVYQFSEVIQPSHPLSSRSPPALSLSQHQGLFQWVDYSHQVAKVLELQLQDQSFQWILRVDFLLDGLVGSPCSPRDSQESSPRTQLKSNNSLVLSLLYGPTLTSVHNYWENHNFD